MLKLELVNNIYICHYTKLPTRKPILDNQLNGLGLSEMSKWVEVYDQDDIDFEQLPKQLPNINKPLKIDGRHNNRLLKKSEISLILKHNYIWNEMIDKNIDNVIVLEDDALLDSDFVNKLNNYTKDLPKDYDLLWIGSCCNLHSKKIENDKHIYMENGSRCTHGYMISLGCAKLMVEFHKINNLPCDFMFNEAIKKYNLKNYWLEPDLVSQNTKFGSSIQGGR